MSRGKRLPLIYGSFMNNLQETPISEYFGVPGKYAFRRTDLGTFELDATFESMPSCKLEQFPIEISIHIASYLYIRDTCTFRLTYNESYPFRPPLWSILSIGGKKEKFTRAMNVLNRQYLESWSPATTLEKDILNIIVQVLHQREI
jgi:hypothetical protein